MQIRRRAFWPWAKALLGVNHFPLVKSWIHPCLSVFIRRFHWSLVIGLLLAFLSATAPGAGLPTVEHWDADRGLPEDTVFSITQTRDGYLWLGTLDGLVRFDGIGRSTGAGRTQFAVFKEDNTPGLTSSRIVKLFADRRENLWIGTETEGVVVVDKSGNTTSFNIGRGSREGALKAVCEDA